jgi:RNA-directed DNA polymerase
MYERGKSDSPVVPAKPPNNAGRPVAEAVEERGLAKGNTDSPTRPGRSAGSDVSSGLDRVREAARRDKDARFTALLHHVDLARLRAAYWAIRPQAAPGIDGVTWGTYGQDLDENLQGLHARVHSGAYRASPSRRAYISKADGRLRPLGIATLEDKIVQRAVVEVLNAIYEEDFLGFSYGFRPGRSPHDALDALTVAIERKKVNWVLDADVKEFFTSLDHDWLAKFVEQIYLHYVLDRWVRQWRQRQAHGDVIITRFADDFVAGFEHQADAQQFLSDLRERFAKFGLELHPDKTRLIEFGRNAARDRAARGDGKPETFDFLGFTHICGKNKSGGFWLKRKTISKRMRAKLHEVKDELKRRRHLPIPEQGEWLGSVVRGHLAYYAVPGNTDAVAAFRDQVTRYWFEALRRRSQRTRLNWPQMNRYATYWLPPARAMHPFPIVRFRVRTQGRSPVR